MSLVLFERLSGEPAFQALFHAGHRKKLAKGRVVIEEGQPPGSLYWLMAGSAAVRLSNWHGREALLAHLHAGDFFGEMGLFGDLAARSARVETRSECLLCEVAYPRFLELTAQHPRLWLELARQLAERLRATNRRLADATLLPAAERIWDVLVELSGHAQPENSGTEGRTLRITRENLGRLAQCSREVAGAALHALESTGRVRLDGHRIVVIGQYAG